ncbi:hypothetical protein CBM2589_B120348 [Cupriavidus taiwanensis]|uniref:Uncharacterized protein n=1 Tax=Cupriavidus taiwanensis TaxID=164546 RepID=A0A375BHE1_9BURK|nr:hypothetical protein CBM2589_B120348 [Cupriavidus taiwanensis]
MGAARRIIDLQKLHPTPQPGEALPLVLPVIGREQRAGRGDRDPGLSRGALHLILK